MRRLLLALVIGLLLVLVVLPAVIVRGCRYSDTAAREEAAGPRPIRVFVHTTGEVVTLPLEIYVAGVVAAEMPTSFALEALKAQAVIARTFAVRNMRAYGGQGVSGRPEADITTDIWGGGQAWMSKAEARKKWGFFAFYSRWTRVEEAVAATTGLIITYDDVPVAAVYHSTCGGATENSEDVWTEALPYLRGVNCPWCAHSPSSTSQVEISLRTIEQAFGYAAGVLAAAAPRAAALEVVDETPSRRAKTVRVGDSLVRALEFRRVLGLKSARFTFTVLPDTVRFVTSGYGHGVGLCQYGADGMARAGKSYREIIDFYYAGVEINLIGTDG